MTLCSVLSPAAFDRISAAVADPRRLRSAGGVAAASYDFDACTWYPLPDDAPPTQSLAACLRLLRGLPYLPAGAPAARRAARRAEVLSLVWSAPRGMGIDELGALRCGLGPSPDPGASPCPPLLPPGARAASRPVAQPPAPPVLPAPPPPPPSLPRPWYDGLPAEDYRLASSRPDGQNYLWTPHVRDFARDSPRRVETVARFVERWQAGQPVVLRGFAGRLDWGPGAMARAVQDV